MLSNIVLKSLMKDKKYARKVLPHIEPEYFESLEKKKLYETIKAYVVKYGSLPNANALKLELTKDDRLSSNLFDNITEIIDVVDSDESTYDDEWLLTETESWCKERSLHNAIIQSVEWIENKENTTAIPELIRNALQVEFESTIGIEFFDEKGIDDRWDEYHKEHTKFPTGVQALDAMFAGGLETKALTVLMSGTSAGKTSSMCAMSANFLRNGDDVLYITLEMAEEKIAQRIDANFLNVDINDVPLMKEKKYKKTLKHLQDKTKGRLVIKEYPPASITVSKLRFLLDELKVKLNFTPTIIVVDYLNLLLSDRIKSDSMYSIVKSIAEELRGLAVEKDLCILSATQGNRQTNDENNSDMDLTNVSESIGLAATCDALVGIIFPAELREQGIQIWKILKNRFGGIVNHKIPLKVNFARAGLYDMEDQNDVNISGNSQANEVLAQTEERRIAARNRIVVDDEDGDGDQIEDDLLDMMNPQD
jgi:replicative DNA helicase